MTIYHLHFDTPLKGSETAAFRGALLKVMGTLSHPLMHNHTNSGLRFSYPLVQYKAIDHKASIVALGDAGLHIQEFFRTKGGIELEIGKHKRPCSLIRVDYSDYQLEVTESPNYYSIINYIPLTDENVAEYDSFMALTDKISFMENILTGNILSMLKGIDFRIEEKIISVICGIEKQYPIRYKGVNFRAFDMHFVTNVVLPDWIGLGKSSSIGMGTIHKEELPKAYYDNYVK